MVDFKLLNTRYKGFKVFLFLYFTVAFISRTILFITSFKESDAGVFNIIGFYVVGFIYDAAALGYIFIPFLIYLAVIPDRIFNHKLHRAFAYGVYFILISALILNIFADSLFWDEFQARFNFIAVDYLIYTTEVIDNIWESYPVVLIFAIIFIISGALVYLMRKKKILEPAYTASTTFLSRLKLSALGLTIPLIAFFALDQRMAEDIFKENRYQQELAKDGLYSLFSAFLNNELDYMSFYPSRKESEIFLQLRSLISTPNALFISTNPKDITRKIESEKEEKQYNVMLICVESLSSKYLTMFGEQRNITPYLDSLVDESVFFTNIFATGTRTVRGMEAITLSVPPSPGRSIVKRPENENLFSPGFIFQERGYDTRFVYGGYGYFDNMNYFFSNNGFDIVDRNDLSDEEITFSNAWGVCDEDLFNRALKEADKSHKSGKPFFNYVMTTSNHRPFTYPDGKIDVPSHEGRHGGVKYTDYAINEFLQAARTKPWFDNTIFVIISDHCGSSAGKVSLDVSKYHIPLYIYAPSILKPERVDKLCSQIDLIPTIYGLLNWDYESKFFGKDIFAMTKEEERALVGNYQKLGLVKKNKLCILSVQSPSEFYTLNEKWVPQPSAHDDSLLLSTIAYYQGHYVLHKEKLNRRD